MAVYNTNLWTGAAAAGPRGTAQGLALSGVFPNLGADSTSELDFDDAIDAGDIHSVGTIIEARDDARRFLWGILEQFYVAYTGGRSSAMTDAQASAGTATPTPNNVGSGKGKTTKMTVSKSSLSLVDEDTAKTTYTVVFNYAVGTPGGDTLEVEEE
jgi:hypothetical protein